VPVMAGEVRHLLQHGGLHLREGCDPKPTQEELAGVRGCGSVVAGPVDGPQLDW
jgi:hypothetical protein